MSYHLAWHQLIVLSMLFDVWAVVVLPFLFGGQVFKHNFLHDATFLWMDYRALQLCDHTTYPALLRSIELALHSGLKGPKHPLFQDQGA